MNPYAYDGLSESVRESSISPGSVDDDEILEDLPPTHLETIRLNRGALIQGLAPPSTDEENPPPAHDDDSESKSLDSKSHSSRSRSHSMRSRPPTPPDSDYASNPPSSIWGASYNTGRVTIPLRDVAGDANSRQTSNVTYFTKPRRSWCLIVLAVVSILLVGAVIAVSVVVFGNKSKNSTADDSPTREQELDRIIYSISDPDTLGDERTPQYKARQWMLNEDSIFADKTVSFSDEKMIQRYVLAVFYYSTNGPTSWESNNWLAGPECQEPVWNGLGCNGNGEVRALGFGKSHRLVHAHTTFSLLTYFWSAFKENFGLVGMLPLEIGHLSKLENLVIKDERLGGALPATLGLLSNLRQLGLYRNELVGGLPVELFRATNITYLNLQGNAMVGAIPEDIGSLSRLGTLALMDNYFNGAIPFGGLAKTQVKFLGLSNNAFRGNISSSIGRLTRLEQLYLDGNELVGEIPLTLEALANLRSIDLGTNQLSGSIPFAFNKLSQAEYLSLGNNNFNGDFPTAVLSMVNLQTLSLAGNAFKGTIPDLSELKGLVNLFLQENTFSGRLTSSFSQLTDLGKLRRLYSGLPLNVRLTCS